MHRVIAHFRNNLVGWIALFVALGGTGYAAISIPRNSVGAAQIRNRSITPAKLNPNSIGGSVRAWAIIRANASVIASSGKPVVFASVFPGSYVIQWRDAAPADVRDGRQRRRALARPDPDPAPRRREQRARPSATPATSIPRLIPTGGGHKISETSLDTFNQAGQPTPMAFDVAVIC